MQILLDVLFIVIAKSFTRLLEKLVNLDFSKIIWELQNELGREQPRVCVHYFGFRIIYLP